MLASAGRPLLLETLLRTLTEQDQTPAEVVLSVPDAGSLPTYDASTLPFNVTVVLGARGLAAQRNAGIAGMATSPEFVFFFDDDAIPRSDYIAAAVEHFRADPNLVGLTGSVVIDGAQLGVEVDRNSAERALSASSAVASSAVASRTDELYGCNFAVRMDALIRTPFDSRLPLYSWLEDLDFARRLGRLGSLAKAPSCVIAHLGSASGGRTQHLRFGYSQLTNPIYLWRKGSITALHALTLVIKPVGSNVIGSVAGASSTWRRQRLEGNARSLGDIVRGRVTPERIVDL